MSDHPALQALGAAMEGWREMLGQVTAAEFTLATPNPGWDVAQVINHSIAVTCKFTVFAAGVTDQPQTPAGDHIGDDHRAAFAGTADRALAAWQCVDLDRSCRLPFGTFTADLAAGINLFDLLAHGWDIHQATGAAFVCPDTAWQAGVDAARRVIGGHRDPRHFAPEVPALPGVTAEVQLLRYLGRSAGTGMPARDLIHLVAGDSTGPIADHMT